MPLIVSNPYVDRVVTHFEEARGESFDIVYSLDDEEEIIAGVNQLRTDRIVGAYQKDGRIQYSEDSAAWFDMGLRSRFGKERADELKRLNTRGHAEIFSEIFGVGAAVPCFYGDAALESSYRE